VPRMAQGLTRTGYRMPDGVDRGSAAILFRAGLRVLRPSLRSVVIAPVSDDPWPEHLRGPVAQLVEMATRQQPVGIVDLVGGGVTIDVRDDGQFALLMVACCYSTGLRGYTDFRVCVVDGGDTGTSLWLALTSDEHSSLQASLRATRRNLGALLQVMPP
jgi:hypothetical protein